MKYSKDFIILAHKACNDWQTTLDSDKCGCFYCLSVFSYQEIFGLGWQEKKVGLCPYCGIDAVIGSKSGLPIEDPDFLQAMQDYWFNS